jgi:hypothetical protein
VARVQAGRWPGSDRLNERPAGWQPAGDSEKDKNMTSSFTIVPRQDDRRADPRYVGVPTEELLLDVSWIRQCRLDSLEDAELNESTRQHTIEYLDHRAAPIIAELKRRHDQFLRNQGRPNVNPWPNEKRFETTLQLAQDLKAAVPLSSYIRSVIPST